MKNPSLLQNPHTEISTAKIHIKDDRRRPPNQKKVQELCDSIEQCGLLNPITVSGKGGEFTLVAGLHRLEAVKRIGWKTIPATVLHSSVPLLIALATIDENLIRCELSPLELAEALEQRKGIYEKLHPTTKKGGDPSTKAKSQSADSAIGFTKDTAAKTGVSERTVRENVQIAKDLSPKVKEQIRGTPIAEKKEELKALASVPKQQQAKVVDKVLSGKASSVRDVVEPKKQEPVAAPSAPIARTLKEKYSVPDQVHKPEPEVPWHCGVAPCPDGQDHTETTKIRGKVCGVLNLPCNQLERKHCPVIERMKKAQEQGFGPAADYDPLTGGKLIKFPPMKITKAPESIVWTPSQIQWDYINRARKELDATPAEFLSVLIDTAMLQEDV